jgi:uracil-DNA glycosylase
VAPQTDWNPVLRGEFEQSYWKDLQTFVAEERVSHTVYPPQEDVFRALHLTSIAATKVLILGQDPYHGPGQANGLAFSVGEGTRIPPSLQNIHKELEADVGLPRPNHGNLESWARQGVLLINATLTVRAHAAASHQKHGWETFTNRVIEAVNQKTDRVVFVLWGATARKKKELVDRSRHVTIESPHPSPLSAHRGFFGSQPFSRTNEALIAAGLAPIDWSL